MKSSPESHCARLTPIIQASMLATCAFDVSPTSELYVAHRENNVSRSLQEIARYLKPTQLKLEPEQFREIEIVRDPDIAPQENLNIAYIKVKQHPNSVIFQYGPSKQHNTSTTYYKNDGQHGTQQASRMSILYASQHSETQPTHPSLEDFYASNTVVKRYLKILDQLVTQNESAWNITNLVGPRSDLLPVKQNSPLVKNYQGDMLSRPPNPYMFEADFSDGPPPRLSNYIPIFSQK